MKTRLSTILDMKKNEDNKEVIKKMLHDLRSAYSGDVFFSIRYDGDVYNNKYSSETLFPDKKRFINYLQCELEYLETEMQELILTLKDVK